MKKEGVNHFVGIDLFYNYHYIRRDYIKFSSMEEKKTLQ